MVMLPPDRTIGARASAKLYDTERLQSLHEQSLEERGARESNGRNSTMLMAIAALLGVSAFLLIWWLVVK